MQNRNQCDVFFSHRSPLVSLIFAVAVFCTLISASLFFLSHGVNIGEENGLLESGQAILLSLAVLAHLSKILQEKNYDILHHVRIGLMLFLAALVLRELDIHEFGVDKFWQYLEKGLRLSLGLVIIYYVYHVFLIRKNIITNLSEILKSRMMVLFFFGCLLYLSGWPFDKNVFNIEKNQSTLIEEFLEFNSTLILLLSSIVSYKCSSLSERRNSED